jgi:hypothetical protein
LGGAQNLLESNKIRFVGDGVESTTDDQFRAAPRQTRIRSTHINAPQLSNHPLRINIGPPMPLADGQVLELGRHRVRHIDTPHVPHGWETRLPFEETTETLLCDHSPPNSARAPTIRSLADFDPNTLAVMHGSSVTGHCASALIV